MDLDGPDVADSGHGNLEDDEHDGATLDPRRCQASSTSFYVYPQGDDHGVGRNPQVASYSTRPDRRSDQPAVDLKAKRRPSRARHDRGEFAGPNDVARQCDCIR